ncbi:ABC transporter substrate-binding protein [Gluconacetobacter azotocaptans]|uniref:ABC transporter substrate-binding protein n=1 Tax=Gluconacetobacter azotocaptans TaxID=142834 RepID=A0A7W4PF81_9PROT|nr:ABC transporter substrate-binding protein [Gluconacetobacter azotocaptans]MBB2190289.1 ABC transporter substrate-binding protein [Gluconacetobacter azotocaptans]GBQ27398.1 spermidine/putrescine-binding periplasmic protein [Gluconacetobacter azotocaptans DSM 13594]
MTRTAPPYRTIIGGLCLLAGLCGPARAGELVFTSWGGAYQDAVRDAWLTPFGKETGLAVLEDTGPSLAKIRAMVETGSVSWDVVGTSGASFMLGVKLGLFERITDDMVDQSHLIPGARTPYGVPSEIFATVLGYSTRAFPHDHPRTFADFWDVKKFPGRRMLPARPTTVLEAALLADGVPAADVYATLSTPAGLQRALDKVRAIRPSVAVWWNSGAQVVQALASGDAAMALGWNGRFQDGQDADLPIAMSWDQSILQVGYFLIVKGAPDRDAAIRFLRYISSAEAQARFSRYVAYGPTRTDVLPGIEPARRTRLPSTPERMARGLFVDNDWWARHGQDATEKYTAVMEGN